MKKSEARSFAERLVNHVLATVQGEFPKVRQAVIRTHDTTWHAFVDQMFDEVEEIAETFIERARRRPADEEE